MLQARKKFCARQPRSLPNAQILNNLGVLAEMRGDRAQARDYYSHALALTASTRERTIAQANLTRSSK